MQLGDPGLELERVLAHPANKPLDGDERALVKHITNSAGVWFPPPVGNPDNPIRCWWCPWGKKKILTERDVLNKRAHTIMAQNAVRSQDFAREVLIHLGFTLPEVIEREKAAMGAPMQLAGLAQNDLSPTTQRIPVLTTQAPARTLAPDVIPVRPPQQNLAALIPWALLALSVFRTFRG